MSRKNHKKAPKSSHFQQKRDSVTHFMNTEHYWGVVVPPIVTLLLLSFTEKNHQKNKDSKDNKKDFPKLWKARDGLLTYNRRRTKEKQLQILFHCG